MNNNLDQKHEDIVNDAVDYHKDDAFASLFNSSCGNSSGFFHSS